MASDTSRSLHLWCSFVHKSVTVYPRSAPGARFSLTKQNKCVRSMFFAYGRDNATPSNSLLGILKFENVYKFKVALFTHKILNGSTNISTIFQRTLTRASEIHTHNTRFASKLNFQRPKANNNYGTPTFAFVSSKLWETIPTNIKDCRTLPSSININYTF